MPTHWALTGRSLKVECPINAHQALNTKITLFLFCLSLIASAIPHVLVPLCLPLNYFSAIASPAHLCQCHCTFCSLVSGPLHLLLTCISAIASPTHLCQCHSTFRSLVSGPLHLPLTCISAIASPAQLCQGHCISHSFVSVPLYLLLSCANIAHSTHLCQCD